MKITAIDLILFWMLYLLIYFILKNNAPGQAWIIIIASQVGFDLGGFYIAFKLYKNSYGTAKKVFFWWFCAFLSGFIADAFFNITVNFFSVKYNLPALLELLVAAPFIFFLIFQNIGWIKILVPIINIKKDKKRSYLHIPVILMGIIVLTIYISAYSSTTHISSWLLLYKIITIIIEVVSFVIISICFAASKISSIRLMATGSLIILACDMVLKINFIYHSMGPNNFADVSWAFGLMLMMSGLFIFNKSPVDFKQWSARTNNIQLQCTFWIFILCFLFLIIFITLGYVMLSSADLFYNEHMKVLACVLIVLSILILWVSYIFTRTLLGPLHKMREAIKKFVSTNKPEIKLLESSYNIIEFDQLNNFIRDSFCVILDRQKIEKVLIDTAAQVVHDIGSPLTAMEVAVKSLENSGADPGSTQLLKSSMLSIRNIASNLLNRYKESDGNTLQNDVIEPRYVVLHSFVEQLIANKRLEWSNAGCDISFKSDLPQHTVYWVFISPSQMARKLSNLLNNAWESLNKSERIITLYLSIAHNNFKLIIEDNGTGIPIDKIPDVLAGKSLKRGGNGIGLSRAVEYFKSLNGSLHLESILNVGTKVILTFPIPPKPVWYPEVIQYNSDMVFVILDDDISIHNLWQKKLDKQKIVSKHFVNSKDFLDWYSLFELKSSLIFFIDYELEKGGCTGLEIINKLSIFANAYLVTGNAEAFWLQDAISDGTIKLIPKSLVGHIILQKY
jgi:signal transduction histidine kinase